MTHCANPLGLAQAFDRHAQLIGCSAHARGQNQHGRPRLLCDLTTEFVGQFVDFRSGAPLRRRFPFALGLAWLTGLGWRWDGFVGKCAGYRHDDGGSAGRHMLADQLFHAFF